MLPSGFDGKRFGSRQFCIVFERCSVLIASLLLLIDPDDSRMPLVVSSELQSSGSTFVARCALVSWLIVFSGIVTPVFRSWFHLEAVLSVCPDTVVVNITESHFDQWTKRR